MEDGAAAAASPMRGRMVHELTGAPVLQPYGQRAHEVIYSVGRAELNRVLIEAATRHAGGHGALQPGLCVGADPAADRLQLRDAASGARTRAAAHAH